MKFRNRNVLSFWTVTYTLCVVMMGTNVPAPLYSIYSRMWDFSSGMVTLLFATYAFVLVPSSLLFGQLSDRFGRKKMLLSGVVTAAVGTLIFAIAHETWMLLLGRAIQGLCVGILNGSAIAMLAELRPGHRKGASFAASVAIAFGTAAGPLISGIVAEYTPFPVRIPYYMHLALLVPAIIGIMVTRETLQQHSRTFRLRIPRVPASIRFPFLTATFVGVFAWAVAGFFMVVAPTFVTSLVGIRNLAVSGAVVFLMLGSSTITQLLFKKTAFARAIFRGFVFLTTGLVGVAVSIPAHSVWLLLLSTAAAGVGHGPAASASLGMVTEMAPAASKADAVSSYYAIAYLGVSVPVLGLGLVAEWLGMYGAILVFSVAVIVGIFILSRFIPLALKEPQLMVAP
ncbi:MFS transporter [Alicyclobacillus sp. SO9]|uniref:MFS transporter n=1 Tax=Alicyclobacillus sp. SO9 TaxID=2665646 RepID=UPI0018E7AC89|nr:MFS transporter [Alicyclobacillus sp. SO9]QQE79242.1 MFS transporter [Alicyclobacillus sp. SO9]